MLDDSFASIVAAIAQGRRIFDNITKATHFTFAVQLSIIALALLPALLHWPVLLLPVHIELLELLIDPACSIVFEAGAAAPDIMTRPPRATAESPFSIDNVGYALAQGLGMHWCCCSVMPCCNHAAGPKLICASRLYRTGDRADLFWPTAICRSRDGSILAAAIRGYHACWRQSG